MARAHVPGGKKMAVKSPSGVRKIKFANGLAALQSATAVLASAPERKSMGLSKALAAAPFFYVLAACGSANDYRFLHSCGVADFLDYTGYDLCAKNIQNARGIFRCLTPLFINPIAAFRR